jgi:hypothetical protein
MEELVYKWRVENHVDGFINGTRAVRGLTNFARDLDPDYRSLEDFLGDNPGIVEAIYACVSESYSSIWEDNLRVNLGEAFPEEDDEY